MQGPHTAQHSAATHACLMGESPAPHLHVELPAHGLHPVRHRCEQPLLEVGQLGVGPRKVGQVLLAAGQRVEGGWGVGGWGGGVGVWGEGGGVGWGGVKYRPTPGRRAERANQSVIQPVSISIEPAIQSVFPSNQPTIRGPLGSLSAPALT